MPPALLDAAIGRWATAKPFLPKACELIALARELMPAPARGATARPLSETYNDRIAAEAGGRPAPRWREDAHGNLFLTGDDA